MLDNIRDCDVLDSNSNIDFMQGLHDLGVGILREDSVCDGAEQSQEDHRNI